MKKTDQADMSMNPQNGKESSPANRKEHVAGIILETVRQKAVLSLGIAVTVCGAVVVSLFPPLVLGTVVDRLSAGEQLAFSLVIAYFALTALTGMMEAVREGLLTVFGQKITHALRSRLMAKMQRLTADGLTHLDPGALVSRFVGDVDTVENLFTSGIISMFADACRIVSILAVIWFRNRGLSLVLLVLLPVLFLFTRTVQKNMLAAQLENRRAVSRASGCVPETLHNIRTIHTLGKESYMEQRYDRYIGDSYRAMEKTNFYDAVYSPVILILNAVVVAIVMLLSASGNPKVLTLFGMSAGTAVAVMNYISQLFTPVESLGMEIQTIQSAIAGVKRINEFLGQEEQPALAVEHAEAMCEEARQKHQKQVIGAVLKQEPAAGGKSRECTAEQDHQAGQSGSIRTAAPVIEFRNVTFGYDEHMVLKHLSFQVQQGEQVTLSGRTGAGKSTILKLLLGLYIPQEGAVLLHGRPVSEIRDTERRKLFGYVEQSFHRVPGTVKEQITLFDKNISMEAVKRATVLTGLDETIMQMEHGYDTECTPELFSQGQWQLLSIARAAAADPELLLLDEITANLDAETEQAVLKALKQVSADRTVISISHRTMAELGRIISI